MRDVITFWQKEIKEKPLEQFYFAVQKPTFIPAWWSCFGWGYSPRQKLQFALLCFSEALVLSWLSELQHILLMGTSPNTPCTHLFTVQQSSQFHFSRKKKKPFGLSTLPTPTQLSLCPRRFLLLWTLPRHLFWQSRSHLSPLYVLYNHLLILISTKYFWSIKCLCFPAHVGRRGCPSKRGFIGTLRSVGLVPRN